MTRTDWALEIEDLSFSYGQAPVLEKVNLKVRYGDFLAIIGPNGGGKTTLVRLILGLIPAKTGRIRVLGGEVKDVLAEIGYVPQDTELNKSFPINVYDVVGMGCRKNGKSIDRDRVEHWLARLGLSGFSGKRLGTLSNGQRKRVFLARALCSEPKMLIMDEPLASVDVESQEMLFGILQNWKRTATMIMVSHDTGVMARYIDSVVCVNRELVHHESVQLDQETFDRMYGTHMQVMTHAPVHVLQNKGHDDA